ncbi:MFS transporter [Maridesulfovibrio sp.]|uniref:MFS transporter n=1 Tax=Maridesulfovibrio sp. TaxID=2795000 RepID=UPI002A18A883|nr:MFS transporter [Maridesulfovibrio sp.]
MTSRYSNQTIVWMIMFGFFVISFVTNILGPIMPNATKDMHLTLTQSGVLPFAFFIAYLVSIPAGYLLESRGSKFTILSAFTLGICGALIFCSNANYLTYLISLFVIGASVAMLQVAFWPLLRTCGGEENYSFLSVLTQVFFGAASFLSPFVFSYLVQNLPYSGNDDFFLTTMTKLIPPNLEWVSIYWLNAAVMCGMVIFIALFRFPRIVLNAEEKLDGTKTIARLLQNETVLIYFFGIFAYVGMEQGISVWITQFLQDYHGVDPNTTGARVVAFFWALQCIGSFIGIVLLRLVDVRTVLKSFLILQLAALSAALFCPRTISILAFPVCGFLTSVMYGSVFSLGMNSLDSHHGSISGIFCTGIIGGAIVPLIVGTLGHYTGLRYGMCFVYLTILYLLYISMTARPLINNKTISASELFKMKRKSS